MVLLEVVTNYNSPALLTLEKAKHAETRRNVGNKSTNMETKDTGVFNNNIDESALMNNIFKGYEKSHADLLQKLCPSSSYRSLISPEKKAVHF